MFVPSAIPAGMNEKCSVLSSLLEHFEYLLMVSVIALCRVLYKMGGIEFLMNIMRLLYGARYANFSWIKSEYTNANPSCDFCHSSFLFFYSRHCLVV